MAHPFKETKVKHLVFWPPFILLVGTVLLNCINKDLFADVMNGINGWLLNSFGWLFNASSLFSLLILIGIYFSPLGKVKIGGSKAKPVLSLWNWWAVTLCMGIGVALIFWATAEPIYHLTSPPTSLGIEPNTPEATIYAMSALFLHWTLTPYAIYTLPALAFAFAYYNMRKPFSVGSMLSPLFGDRMAGRWGQAIDAICVFTIVAGMASSLGVGVMSIGGGLDYIFGIKSGIFIWTIVIIVVVASYVASAVSGLTNGIKWLSDFNAKVFIGLLIFVAIFSPLAWSLNLGFESMGNYLSQFFTKSLFTGTAAGDPWPQAWSIFYWCLWLAWAPISAVFLGRIGVGYTVRQFILVNLFLPAIFAAIWMTVFGGASLHVQVVENLPMAQVLADKGPEGTIYFLLSQYPLAVLTIPVFIFMMYMSFVTGSDAMCTAIGGMCSTGISPESPEPPNRLKIIWGIIPGFVAWVMMSFKGIDGLKMICTFGGFPAMLLNIAAMVAIWKVVKNPKKYDAHKEDYAIDGTYKNSLAAPDQDLGAPAGSLKSRFLKIFAKDKVES